MLRLAKQAWPSHLVTVSVDNEYSCKPVLDGLPENFELVGRFRAGTVLYNAKVPPSRGNRPRIWGERLGNLAQLADEPSTPWETTQVWIYGRSVEMHTKRFEAVWKSAGPDRRLCVVITRDPSGRLEDSDFFSTHRKADSREVIEDAADRWSLEACFRDSKQHLGLEGVCNGFARRRHRRKKKVSGPDNEPGREPMASKRTVPMGLLVYGLVVVWVLENGQPELDIVRVRRLSPWWRHKTTVSFADMLAAFRRQFWEEAYSLTSYSSSSPDRLADDPSEHHSDEHHLERWTA